MATKVRWPYPRLIAHRGGGLAPENTLPAFAEAARRGYRAIECDVTLTADHIPVLFHDETLERTAAGVGAVAEATWSQLAELDAGAWFHSRFSGTRIPRLEQAISAWHQLGLQAFIELKVDPGQDPEHVGTVIASTVAACWQGDPPVFISFSGAALVAAAKVAAHIPRALLLGTPWLDENPWPFDWHQQMVAASATALDLDHSLVTRERVEELHQAQVPLVTWTVNDPARAAELLSWGVDGVTTDAIDLIAP